MQTFSGEKTPYTQFASRGRKNRTRLPVVVPYKLHCISGTLSGNVRCRTHADTFNLWSAVRFNTGIIEQFFFLLG